MASKDQQNSTSVVEFSHLNMFSVLKSENKMDGCPNAKYDQHGRSYCCICPPAQPTIYCAHNFSAAAGHPIGVADSDDL